MVLTHGLRASHQSPDTAILRTPEYAVRASDRKLRGFIDVDKVEHSNPKIDNVARVNSSAVL